MPTRKTREESAESKKIRAPAMRVSMQMALASGLGARTDVQLSAIAETGRQGPA
jgi:hypothetical protein